MEDRDLLVREMRRRRRGPFIDLGVFENFFSFSEVDRSV